MSRQHSGVPRARRGGGGEYHPEALGDDIGHQKRYLHANVVAVTLAPRRRLPPLGQAAPRLSERLPVPSAPRRTVAQGLSRQQPPPLTHICIIVVAVAIAIIVFIIIILMTVVIVVIMVMVLCKYALSAFPCSLDVGSAAGPLPPPSPPPPARACFCVFLRAPACGN